MPVVSVGGAGRVQNGAGENGLREDARGVVNQLGKRVRGVDRESVREPLLQLRGRGVIAGVADIVSKQGHIGEPRIRT